MSFEPGTKYAYSNIGYWLLGKIIERATGQAYSDYTTEHILRPLGIQDREIDFGIPNPANHAKGYLAKYSILNLMKRFFTDSNVWGQYEGNWLQVRNIYLNGPAFGGLAGSARAFSRLLQDQLAEHSALFGPATTRDLHRHQYTTFEKG